MGKRVIVSVINDLVTDQRVSKSCHTLNQMGFEVLLIGRKLPGSPAMDERQYPTIRMKLPFRRGPMFYALFNFRLFLLLLRKHSDLLLANDLDTLLPNYLVSRFKGIPLVYDTHEYFTEVPELVKRRNIQRIWEWLEGWIFPKLNDIITVNDSIAGLYEEKYGKKLVVVRNVSRHIKAPPVGNRKSAGLPEGGHLMILQGSGINIQRGAEELVLAMKKVDDAFLLIVGGGDVMPALRKMVVENKLQDRVFFKPRQPYPEMMRLTALADLGLTLDKDTNINYRYSLPNKLFDYIQARIPVLASPLPEVRKIIETYKIGALVPSHDPVAIADKINEIFADQGLMAEWKNNVNFAASQLNWENEEQHFIKVFTQYV